MLHEQIGFGKPEQRKQKAGGRRRSSSTLTTSLSNFYCCLLPPALQSAFLRMKAGTSKSSLRTWPTAVRLGSSSVPRVGV